jgi:hypothetical protein
LSWKGWSGKYALTGQLLAAVKGHFELGRVLRTGNKVNNPQSRKRRRRRRRRVSSIHWQGLRLQGKSSQSWRKKIKKKNLDHLALHEKTSSRLAKSEF